MHFFFKSNKITYYFIHPNKNEWKQKKLQKFMVKIYGENFEQKEIEGD